MELKDLAAALRYGNLLQFANDRVHATNAEDGHVYDKSKATDEELIGTAATCYLCDRTASDDDIVAVMQTVKNAKEFCVDILEKINHEDDCPTLIDDVDDDESDDEE